MCPCALWKEIKLMEKKLYRTEGREALLFGVCGGIAEYFNLDPT